MILLIANSSSPLAIQRMRFSILLSAIDHGLDLNLIGFIRGSLNECRTLPITPCVQLATDFLGDRNIHSRRKSGCSRELALAHAFGVGLVREFHFVGSVDAVLARDAIASGASCGSSGNGGDRRTGLVLWCTRFFLRLCFLWFFLSLAVFLSQEFRGRGDEVQVAELASIVLELWTFALTTFRSVAVLSNQGSATPQYGETSLGTLFQAILLVG